MLKSKFFRVAKAGQTIDGREITADQIKQMAASYNPKTYGARIWVEHMRSLFADGLFPAVGDVLSLAVEEDGDETYLTAQINPTDQLVKMNAARQKVFFSIEMDPNFSDTGEAYLVGLGVTDTPASLGTEMMQFNCKKRKAFNEESESGDALTDGIFSEGLEVTGLDFTEEEDDRPGVLSKVKEMLSRKQNSNEKRFTQLEDSILAIADSVAKLEEKIDHAGAEPDTDNQDFASQVEDLKKTVNDITTKLSAEPAPNQSARPQADGTGDHQLTDC